MTQSPPPDGRVAKWILLLTLAIVLLSRLASGQEVGNAPPVSKLYENVKRASVEILVDGHHAGSGAFVDDGGLVLTAAHVIDRPGRRIELLSPVAGRIAAKEVAVDLGHDIVVLQADKREGGYPTLAVAETAPVVGDEVFLFGAPLYRRGVLLRGMVARNDTAFEYYTGRFNECTHVSVTAQAGTSGGPWLDRHGRIVGVQSGVMAMNNVPIGLAYMIPLEAVARLVKDRRNAVTPTIGAALEELWQHGGDVLKRFPPSTEGLVLRGIQPNGPAARAGLKEWDLVTAADGQKVRVLAELIRIIRAKKSSETIKLTILGPDGTGTREAAVRLGRLEVAWPDAPKK